MAEQMIEKADRLYAAAARLRAAGDINRACDYEARAAMLEAGAYRAAVKECAE